MYGFVSPELARFSKHLSSNHCESPWNVLCLQTIPFLTRTWCVSSHSCNSEMLIPLFENQTRATIIGANAHGFKLDQLVSRTYFGLVSPVLAGSCKHSSSRVETIVHSADSSITGGILCLKSSPIEASATTENTATSPIRNACWLKLG